MAGYEGQLRCFCREVWETYFQTKLKVMRPLMPRTEPIQSIGSDLLVGSSGGSKSARLPKTINPSMDLIASGQLYSVILCKIDRAHMKINSHFQGVSSARRPANNVPNHPPTGAPAPKNPRLKLRILPGGSVVPMTAIALGTIIAAPIPLKALATLKAMKLLQKALMNDQRTHQAAPPSRIFL